MSDQEQREARIKEIKDLVDDLYDAVSASRFGPILHDAPVTTHTPQGKSINQFAFAVFQTLLSNMCPKSPSKVLSDGSLAMRHEAGCDE